MWVFYTTLTGFYLISFTAIQNSVHIAVLYAELTFPCTSTSLPAAFTVLYARFTRLIQATGLINVLCAVFCILKKKQQKNKESLPLIRLKQLNSLF